MPNAEDEPQVKPRLEIGGVAKTEAECGPDIVTGQGSAAVEGAPILRWLRSDDDNLIWLLPRPRN